MHQAAARLLLAVGLVGAGMLPANAAPPSPMGPQPKPLLITGSANYRERVALPPAAMFEATLEDVSRAGAPSLTLGRARIDAPRVPVQFSIAVDSAALTAQGRYAVRPRITLDGRLLFTSDTVHPVLGNTGVRQVDILMRAVAAP